MVGGGVPDAPVGLKIASHMPYAVNIAKHV